MFWKTKVNCWYRDKPRARLVKKVERWIIGEAEEADDAMKKACKHAENTAPMGPKWVAFEATECASVKLPLTVASCHVR
jgi:hypothetical protein